VREYRELLRDVPWELVSLPELGINDEVEETGESFEENAWLKARTYAAWSGLLALADDSGLEVDALQGEPGIRSARYGGDPGASDRNRVELVLQKLKDIPWERRTARFRCVIAIACPNGEGVAVVGSVAGMIQYEPQGNDGFGYDPIFYLPSYGRTMAQLPLEEKNRVSHRADAARKAVVVLKQMRSA